MGLGIAGSSLISELIGRNKSFVCIDNFNPDSASHVSSGLINPITGRKFVKSWMIDEFLPKAVETYQSFERLLDQKLLNDKLIIRSLHNANDENQFFSRTTNEEYQEYITESYDGPAYDKYLKEAFSFTVIKKSLNLDTSSLLKSLRLYLIEHSLLNDEEFEHGALKYYDTHLEYNGIHTKHILFAEGANALNNPYFKDLPFRPVKGEVLICKIEDFPESHILKYHKFLVPLGNNLFWVGSTYDWDYSNPSASKKGYSELKQFLDSYLSVDYDIVDHKAGIRPATKYRKPFVGTHPIYNNIHILNGLGTKGISLAPYWSNYLIDRIEKRVDKSIQLPSTILL